MRGDAYGESLDLFMTHHPCILSLHAMEDSVKSLFVFAEKPISTREVVLGNENPKVLITSLGVAGIARHHKIVDVIDVCPSLVQSLCQNMVNCSCIACTSPTIQPWSKVELNTAITATTLT